MLHRRILGALGALAVLSLSALAADAPKERVTIAGTIVCVGCHLEKHGADPQCTLHAKHAQGLLAEDGTLYTFLDNARGHLVATDRKLRDRKVKLEAYRFPKAQVLEVIRYQVEEGGAYVQWDYCKTCGFEKGDNQGKDLCRDCEE